MLNKRRQARELALRGLYAHEMSGNPIDAIVQDMIMSFGDETEDHGTRQFAKDLALASIEKREEIEKLIVQQAHNWDFDRIAILDKICMRIAIAELLCFEDIPPKVTIDEAIEISKKYSTERSGHFVNGILDGVLTYLKQKGLLNKSGRGLQE